MDLTLKDVVERLIAEGQLTRNTGTNSIKSVSKRLDTMTPILRSIDESMIEQNSYLRKVFNLQAEALEKQATKEKLGSVDKSVVEKKGGSRGPDISVSEKTSSAIGGLASILGGAGIMSMLGRGGLSLGIGLGALGIGIGAFFTGLAGADMAIGKFGDGENVKKMLSNLGEGLAAFSSRDLTALGALLGAGALFGAVSPIGAMKAGVGMGAIGLGIGGFFTGLAVGDSLGAMMGTDLSNFKTQMQNLSEGLAAFSARDLSALGVMLGTGALFGAVNPVGSLTAAVGMTAIGFGIGGFFTGLAAGDTLGAMMGSDLSNFKTQMQNLSEGLAAFSGRDLSALGAMLGMGALFGAVSPVGSLTAAVGMTAIGFGIGGFFAGLAAADAAANWMNVDGSKIKSIMQNLAEGLSSFSDGQLVGLSALLGAGALFGPAAAGAAVGMGLIGVGLGAFFAGWAGAGDLASMLSIDGSGMKELMVNLAGGLTELGKVDGSNLLTLSAGIAALGPAMLAFLGSQGIAGIGAQISGSLGDLYDNIFGSGEGGEGGENQSVISMIVEQLKPLEQINFGAIEAINGTAFRDNMLNISAGMLAFTGTDFVSSLAGVGTSILNFLSGSASPFDRILEISDNAEKLEAGANALERIANALSVFANIQISRMRVDFEGMAEDLGKAIPLLRGLAEGGVVGEGWIRSGIDFENGILDPSLRLDEIAERVQMVRRALGADMSGSSNSGNLSIQGNIDSLANSEGMQILQNYTDRMIELSENMLNIFERIEDNATRSGSPILINQSPVIAPSVQNNIRGGSNTSQTNISGGGGSFLDYGLPRGPQ